MQRDGARALTIGVMVKTGEFRRHSKQVTLQQSTADPEFLFRTASELLRDLTNSEEGLFARGQVLRLIGVSASNLDSSEYRQIGLFDWAREAAEAAKKAERDRKLGKMMQELSRKFGDNAVVRGNALQSGPGDDQDESSGN